MKSRIFSRVLWAVMVSILLLPSWVARAGEFVQRDATEEQFRQVFVTAAYSAAFGAAVGAALLPFSAKPGRHLGLVTSGASVGFLAGSVLGFARAQRRWSPDSGSPGEVPPDELDWIEPAGRGASTGFLLERHDRKTAVHFPVPRFGAWGLEWPLVHWTF